MKYSEQTRIEHAIQKHIYALDKASDSNSRTAEYDIIRCSNAWLDSLDEPSFESVLHSVAHLGMILVADDSYFSNASAYAALSYILGNYGRMLHLSVEDIGAIRYASDFSIENIMKHDTTDSYSGTIRIPKSVIDSIENALTEYAINPITHDEALIVAARSHVEECVPDSQAPIFRRMKNRIDILCEILSDASVGEDTLQWARAGLSYFVVRNDSIEDDLGYAGLFDDSYAILTAYELAIGRPSNLGFLGESILRRYPVIRDIEIHRESSTSRGYFHLSDYLLANLSIADQALLKELSCSVALPISRNVPILVGWLIALLKSRNYLRPININDFNEGDTVLVDHKYPAEYLGIENTNDSDMFRLKIYPRGKYKRPILYSYSVQEIDRLSHHTPIDEPTGNKGTLPNSRRNASTPVTALERLFNTHIQPSFAKNHAQIMIISTLGHAIATLRSLRLHGQRLIDVIPIHKIDIYGNSVPIGTYWQESSPILLISPNTDLVNHYLDENPQNNVELVILDSAIIWPQPELGLEHSQCQKVVFFTRHESSMGKRLLDNPIFKHIEWTRNDISALPEHGNDEKARLLINSEDRMSKSPRSNINYHVLPSDSLNSAWKNVDILRCSRSKYGDNVPPDYLKGLISSYALIKRLLAMYVPLQDVGSHADKRGLMLERVAIAESSVYIEKTDARIFGLIRNDLSRYLEDISEHNPLLETIRSIVSRSDCEIACGNRSVMQQMLLYHELEASNPRIIDDYLRDYRPDRQNLLLLPSYPVQYSLLHSLEFPVSKTTHVLQSELGHYRLIRAARRYAAEIAMRKRLDCRSELSESLHRIEDISSGDLLRLFELQLDVEDLFCSVDSDKGAAEDQGLDENRDILRLQSGVYEDKHSRVGDIRDSCWRIWFTDGSLAYMSESTHLDILRNLPDDTCDAMLESIDRNGIRCGDKAVFLADSSSEAVRDRADRILENASKTRAIGRLWVEALQGYSSEYSDIYEAAKDIQHQLLEYEIERTLQTIICWLNGKTMFPQNRNQVLKAIAGFTGNAELASNLTKCINALKRIQIAHLKAGKEIAREIYRSLRESIDAGLGITECVEVSDRLLLVEVDQIDKAEVEVERGNIGIRLGDHI